MQMATEQLVCGRCNTPVPAADWNREHAFCLACHAPVKASVFPAFFARPEVPSSGTLVLEEGESSCFYHARKRAVVPCDRCGRFLCSLCQVNFLGQNWCPQCVQAGSQKGELAQLDSQRTLYDNLALMLATVPLLVFVLTPITAPVSLYVAIRYWRAPSSILPRTKIRFYIAAVLAVLQIAGWIWLALFFLFRLYRQ